MAHERPLILLIVLLIVGGGLALWYVLGGMNGSADALRASGTIEASDVTVSPELAGQVAVVRVEEGDFVRAGEVLFQLDDSLLRAQREVAAAALESAQAAERTAESALEAARVQHELTLAAARAEEGEARIRDWLVPAPDRFDQPAWYFTRAEQIAAAEAGVQAAREAYEAAQSDLETLLAELGDSDLLEAEQRLAQARLAYQVAYDLYARSQRGQVPTVDVSSLPPQANTYRVRRLEYQRSSDNDDLIDAAREIFDDAKDELDAAQEAYDALLGSKEAEDLQQARADVAAA